MKKLSEHEREFLRKMQAEALEIVGRQMVLYSRICTVLGLPNSLPYDDEQQLAVFAFAFDHQDATRLEAELDRARAGKETATS